MEMSMKSRNDDTLAGYVVLVNILMKHVEI